MQADKAEPTAEAAEGETAEEKQVASKPASLKRTFNEMTVSNVEPEEAKTVEVVTEKRLRLDDGTHVSNKPSK